MKTRRGTLMALAGAIAICGAANADTVKLTLTPSGGMPKMGGYMPQRLALSPDKPAELKKAPALTKAIYGVLSLGPAESPTKFVVAIDEPAGQPSRILIDSNGNGDLTDDDAPQWSKRENPGPNGTISVIYTGGATVKVKYGANSVPVHLGIYRFGTPRPGLPANTLLYYADYAAEGKATIAGKTYNVLLADRMATGDFRCKPGAQAYAVSLMIDLNGDGQYDDRWEVFDAAKPFNIGGTTYEVAGIAASGTQFDIVRSSKTVAEKVAPPDLTPGKAAPAFTATTTDGKPLRFPSDYKGKLVLLDFWATWCGPCLGELPSLTKVYEQYHPKGLEVLGVSLDQANYAEKLAAFTREKNMPWRQVYDGKYWQAAVAQTYGIQSIPHPVLVDGDTGKIVADGNALRGERLAQTVEKALADKK